MGTHSVTLVRERRAKKNRLEQTSALGGPTDSKYFYKYYVCIYQHYDGYVRNGVGEFLANFLCELIRDFKNTSSYIDVGLIAAKVTNATFSMSERPRLIPIGPLRGLLEDYEYAYIITINSEHQFNDNSIMLSVIYNEFILTARPEKFLEKYEYYETKMEETDKSFEEINAKIDYGDNEVDKEGYFSEEQLLIK